MAVEEAAGGAVTAERVAARSGVGWRQPSDRARCDAGESGNGRLQLYYRRVRKVKTQKSKR